MADEESPAAAAARRSGIPPAQFIEDVPAYLASLPGGAAEALATLNAAHAGYRRLEGELSAARARLQAKVPELERSLAAVRLLAGEGPGAPPPDADLVLDFALTDQAFARARVERSGSGKDGCVGLWLGAGVMAEFPLPEAADLLAANLATARAGLDANAADLAFIKDCVTTTQVSLARVYNADVAAGRAAKVGGGGGGGGGKKG
jgi:hypothetical protein